jgi:hypothetical protein
MALTFDLFDVLLVPFLRVTKSNFLDFLEKPLPLQGTKLPSWQNLL